MIFQLFLGNVEVIFNAYSWGGREGNQIATESQIIYFEVEFVVRSSSSSSVLKTR